MGRMDSFNQDGTHGSIWIQGRAIVILPPFHNNSNRFLGVFLGLLYDYVGLVGILQGIDRCGMPAIEGPEH